MARVPTYESQESLNPTPIDPRAAASLGNSVVDLSAGLDSVGQLIQKVDDRRQTYKAETSLAKAHQSNYQMVATDPDIDSLDHRLEDRTNQDIQNAAQSIQSPEARNNFVAKAQLDSERRNAPLYRTIMARKSADVKQSLVQANDADVLEYQGTLDPDERNLIKQKIIDRSNQAIADGHINPQWGKAHIDSILKAADHNTIKDDIANNPTVAYEHLQKGKDGLYPELSPADRKMYSDRALKQIQREGSDNKLIYNIAQNHAESQLIDKMAQNNLTQSDINNAMTLGIKGIRPRSEFAKSAAQAINDPFPTESVSDKYNTLINQIQDPDMDPITLKMNVLNSRGLSPQEKAHLITAHLREDPEDGKQSINQLINSGIKQNKQALMQADKNLKAELAYRQSMFRKITDRFRDHARDQDHLAKLQKDYMDKLQNTKDDKERLELAQEIMNGDTLKRNPGIATSNAKGTIFIDKTTGSKRRYYPSGFWEPVKTDEQ